MNRREFSTQLGLAAAAATAALSSAPAAAQGGPVEGTHYLRLQTPAPVSVPSGKIEVVSFFALETGTFPVVDALHPDIEGTLVVFDPGAGA